MITIASLLAEARNRLQAPEAALEGELLLDHVTGGGRASFRAFPERVVSVADAARFRELVERRASGEPIAYIVGETGFWSLMLYCDPSTLIPRPETEQLVETALSLGLPATASVLDLGTGTGAIALALASEQAQWRIIGVDRSPPALQLAERNRIRCGVNNVRFMQSDWFAGLESGCRFDLVVSNPPYVAQGDPHLERGDLRFEPGSALVGGCDGLRDIEAIASGAREWLEADGWLLLEHGFDQGSVVSSLLTRLGYRSNVRCDDLTGHWRVSGGQLPPAAGTRR